jgi:hypothetical protein
MSKNLLFLQSMLKPWQAIFTSPFLRGSGGILVLGVLLCDFSQSQLIHTSLLSTQPAYAQRVSSTEVWQQVYKQLPDLPKENQYISKETGKVAENNTLVSRMIRYHVYVKGRPPNYRLDWKLTLADYLDANELMYDGSYPGNDTLRQNPFEGDRTAIRRLNRRQRDALIQALVNGFSQK